MADFSMDQFRLDGKVAVVTGASDGIGFGIACGLAYAGAKIAFNSRSQTPSLLSRLPQTLLS